MIGQEQGDIRVRRVLDQLGLKYSVTDSGSFKLLFDVGDGRSQLAWIDSTTHIYQSLEIREIWSVGYEIKGEIPQGLANKLLRINNSIKLGAWRVFFDGTTSYALFAVHTSASADAASIRSLLELVTTTSDSFEREHAGGDRY